MAVQEITGPEFEKEVLQSEIPVILDLWADWCHPCKMIEPYLEELAVKYAGKVKVVRLNVDDYPDIPSRYGVLSIPTVIFFKGGKEVDRIVGAMPKHHYELKIQEVLGA